MAARRPKRRGEEDDDEGPQRKVVVQAVEESEAYHATNEEEGCLDIEVYDEKIGVALPMEMVRAARKEELDYMQSIPLYDVVDEGECWGYTGKGSNVYEVGGHQQRHRGRSRGQMQVGGERLQEARGARPCRPVRGHATTGGEETFVQASG